MKKTFKFRVVKKILPKSRMKTRASLEISPLRYNSLGNIFLERKKFDMNPDYQRESAIWSTSNRQLLIDSLINRFDIPKLYVHVLKDAKESYAVVDGKQRLEAIWDFLDGKYPLADDFIFLKDPNIDLASKTFTEIGEQFPDIVTFFNGIPLPMYEIHTDDIDLIEELFSRLNDAAPLNAPEKRNALGGPVPKGLRGIADTSKFFSVCLPFMNRRYKYLDLACKFMLLIHRGKVVDVKKRNLDSYVIDMRDTNNTEDVRMSKKEVEKILAKMATVFTAKDKLLKNIGTVVAIFWLFKAANDQGLSQRLNRSAFLKFDSERDRNRDLARAGAKAGFFFIRFEELSSTVNDAYAILFKSAVIASVVLPELVKKSLPMKEALDASSED